MPAVIVLLPALLLCALVEWVAQWIAPQMMATPAAFFVRGGAALVIGGIADLVGFRVRILFVPLWLCGIVLLSYAALKTWTVGVIPVVAYALGGMIVGFVLLGVFSWRQEVRALRDAPSHLPALYRVVHEALEWARAPLRANRPNDQAFWASLQDTFVGPGYARISPDDAATALAAMRAFAEYPHATRFAPECTLAMALANRLLEAIAKGEIPSPSMLSETRKPLFLVRNIIESEGRSLPDVMKLAAATKVLAEAGLHLPPSTQAETLLRAT